MPNGQGRLHEEKIVADVRVFILDHAPIGRVEADNAEDLTPERVEEPEDVMVNHVEAQHDKAITEIKRALQRAHFMFLDPTHADPQSRLVVQEWYCETFRPLMLMEKKFLDYQATAKRAKHKYHLGVNLFAEGIMVSYTASSQILQMMWLSTI